MQTVRRYYWLAKPGIVYSNVIAGMAGFFLASGHKGTLDLGLFLATIIGIAFVIASACVLNNYTDRGIDGKMKRTQKRPTVTSKISGRSTLVYAAMLAIIGFVVLGNFTNELTMFLGIAAYVAYIVLYGLAKRHTVHGTLVGTIAGGLPPVAGYAAVTNQLDINALFLFLVLVAWQMPHFYAIAMRRHDEYAAASIPVLPVVKGMHATKVQILVYTSLFIVINILFAMYGAMGYVYAIVMTLLGVLWLAKGIKGFKTANDQDWARRMFLFSLIVLLSLCAMLTVGGLLP
jgi:protoheme IX farnesyltransferase